MCGEPKQALLPACPCGVEEFFHKYNVLPHFLNWGFWETWTLTVTRGGKDIIDYLPLPVVKCHFQQQTKLQFVYDPVKIHLPVFILSCREAAGTGAALQQPVAVYR